MKMQAHQVNYKTSTLSLSPSCVTPIETLKNGRAKSCGRERARIYRSSLFCVTHCGLSERGTTRSSVLSQLQNTLNNTGHNWCGQGGFKETSLLYEILNKTLHLFYNRHRFLLKGFTRRSPASRHMPLAS